MTVLVNHVEIPILDLKKAKSFFDAIFEWDMDIKSMPDYGLVDMKNATSIGFPIQEKIPEIGINVIFGVEDIEECLKLVNKHGGKTHVPKYQITPEIGYAAEFLDCFGNRLGLFSAPVSDN